MNFDTDNLVKTVFGNRRSELVKPSFTLDKFRVGIHAMGWFRDVAGEECFNHVTQAAFEALCRRRMGLLLGGSTGRGKTAFLKALTARRGSQVTAHPLVWVNLGIEGEEGKLSAERFKFFNIDPMQCLIVIDDLGAEYQVNDYGVKRSPVADFITKYHEHGQYRLFATTNLTSKQLVERYGDPLWSRLREMCYCVKLEGRDHRQDESDPAWHCPSDPVREASKEFDKNQTKETK